MECHCKVVGTCMIEHVIYLSRDFSLLIVSYERLDDEILEVKKISIIYLVYCILLPRRDVSPITNL